MLYLEVTLEDNKIKPAVKYMALTCLGAALYKQQEDDNRQHCLQTWSWGEPPLSNKYEVVDLLLLIA